MLNKTKLFVKYCTRIVRTQNFEGYCTRIVSATCQQRLKIMILLLN